MADCNYLFQKFLLEISLKPDQRKNLQKGRDAIKELIENYFSEEKGVAKPEFYLQGSYALKTMVQPLGKEDYDLDDGVYLQHTDDDKSRPSPVEASNLILEAVKGHATKTENKKNCVRVVYAEGYHIDLPIYRMIGGKIYLGTLDGNEWIPSDAKAFNDWFYSRLEKTEQMRSCIKYLKAGKDIWRCDLKGIHITVLVALNHVPVKSRDDESLVETLAGMFNYLNKNRRIDNPIDPNENLLNDWSDSRITAAVEALAKACEHASKALQLPDKRLAAEQWRCVLGTRFPLPPSGNKTKGDGNRKQAPVVIVKNPQPWSPGWL